MNMVRKNKEDFMSILIVISFDLEQTDPADYPCMYAALESRQFYNKFGGEELPSTTVVGTFSGADVSTLVRKAQAAFDDALRHCKKKGRAFIVASESPKTMLF